MKVAVIRFPGSNCDLDAIVALDSIDGFEPKLVWHETGDLSRFDAAILPGGFSYGDFLRAGAIAATSPVIREVRRLAEEGKPVLGICNGFQVLVEAGLLPGALLRNTRMKFICKWVNLEVENDATPFTLLTPKSSILRMPIAHNEGRFYLGTAELHRLVKEGRVVYRYVDSAGRGNSEANPNGSVQNIAGIANSAGNVVGLMPHPERACDILLDPLRTADGRLLFQSMLRQHGQEA